MPALVVAAALAVPALGAHPAAAKGINDCAEIHQVVSRENTSDGELITIEVYCRPGQPGGSYPSGDGGSGDGGGGDGPGGGGGAIPPDIVDPDPGGQEDPGGQSNDPAVSHDDPPPGTEEEYLTCLAEASRWREECGSYVCAWGEDTPWNKAIRDWCLYVYDKACSAEHQANLRYCDQVKECIAGGAGKYWCRMKFFFPKGSTGGSYGDPWPDKIDRIERKKDPDGTK